MAKKLTEEMKRYISTKFMDEKEDTSAIIRGFGEAYGFLPSASTINKYQYFNKNNPVKEEEEEEENGEEDEGKVTVITKDTRLEKNLLDFSDGIEQADVERLARNIEKTPKATFDLLKEASSRGYTKVNMVTGDIEK